MYGYKLPAYVYFIETARCKKPEIKIGYSWRPDLRLKRLERERGRKLRLIHTIYFDDDWVARSVERRFHKDFSRFRLRGEWFSADPFIYYCLWVFKSRGASGEEIYRHYKVVAG